jgi:hypothetical protein
VVFGVLQMEYAMKKIVLGVIAALTVAGAVSAVAVSAHIPPSCFCDQYGCVCE